MQHKHLRQKYAVIKYDQPTKDKAGKIIGYAHHIWLNALGNRRHRQIASYPETDSKAERNEKRRAAEQIAIELEHEYQQFLAGKSPEVAFAVALDKYIEEEIKGNKPGGVELKDAHGISVKLSNVSTFGEGRMLSELPQIATDYANAELSRRMLPQSVNKVLSRLKTFAAVAYGWKHPDGRRWLEKPLHLDMKMLEVTGNTARNSSKDFLNYDQLMAIIDHCKAQDVRDFVLVACFTGMRKEEVGRIHAPEKRLRVRNVRGEQVREKPYTVNWERMVIEIPDQKSGKEDVEVPIIPLLEEPLSRFPLPYTTDHYYRHFKVACAAAGLPDAHVHTIRKSLGFILVEMGVSTTIGAAILRNTTAQFEATYCRISEDSKRRALEGLMVLEARRKARQVGITITTVEERSNRKEGDR